MEIDDLGAQLRRRRVAADRTIASVAGEAGLSVPYIANLENGRGNPTLSAVNRLARALGARIALAEAGGPPADRELPESLMRFARSDRFRRETARLDRPRLLRAMADLGELAGRPLSDLDWHRMLDTVVLITRG